MWGINNSGLSDDLKHSEDIYRDTQRMAVQLNIPFNPKWSMGKMIEKHEDFTHRINIGRYSPEKLKSVSKVKVKDLEYDGYRVTLLQSPLEIRTEGQVMKHCVGSYSSAVSEGNYLIYSITKEGVRSSTLGISINNTKDDRKNYSFSQHYKHCNGRVTCEIEKSLGGKVINLLNKDK